jgi:hypothetical protein
MDLFNDPIHNLPFDFIRRLGNEKTLGLGLNYCGWAWIDCNIAFLLLIILQLNCQKEKAQTGEQKSAKIKN